MEINYGTNASDLLACIGPSISVDRYEVGSEVIREVEKVFGGDANLLVHTGKGDKCYFNLWKANKLQLLKAGLKEKNIEIAGICTYINSDQFYSARKSKNNTGRFAAGIMLL